MTATLQEQLEIIQAAIDGKEIEIHRTCDGRGWETTFSKEFDFMKCTYRIKPEKE